MHSLRRAALLLPLLALFMSGGALADDVSGPDRTTMIKQDWGTIYHLPFSFDTQMSEDIFGEFTIKNRGTMTSVKQEGHSDGYLVFYPDKTSLTVRKHESGEIVIDLRGKRSYFRPTPDGWVLKMPDDEIRLRHKDHEVRISGKQGTTVCVDGPNGFTITSAAGETRYAREDFDTPFKLSGVAVQSHPYVVRGVWFQAEGIGAFVDFKLRDYSRAFTVLGWYPMIQIDGHR
jgi:hypothetical protein